MNGHRGLEPFLFVSLIVHAVFVAALLRLEKPQHPGSKTIDVVFLDAPQPRERQQIVTDPNLKPLANALEKLKEKAKYLSRETRRVEREMRARRTGPTQNSFPKPSANTSITPSEPGAGPSINRPLRAAEHVRLSESTIAEYIPEVREGGFTALNTDQFMYYTFYARINEQIRNRWVNNLRQFANTAGPHELNRLSQREQVTQLEIILNSEGHFQQAIFHRRSDHPQLDAAAAVAIRNAAPFLNPPSEIVKEDGTVRLYYEFHVHWRPQYLAGPRR